MPVNVVNSSGQMTPFEPARTVGSLVLSGVPADVAISRTQNLQNAIQSSGAGSVTSVGLSHALMKLGGSLGPPDLSAVATALTTSTPGAAAAATPVATPPPAAASPSISISDLPPVPGIARILVASGDISSLVDGQAPLATLLGAGASIANSFARQLNAPSSFASAFQNFAEMLGQGAVACSSVSDWLSWRESMTYSVNSLSTSCAADPAGFLAKGLLDAFLGTLGTTVAPTATDPSWQIPVVAALATMSTSLMVDMTGYIAMLHTMGVRSDCPPCPDGCSSLWSRSTTYEDVEFSNPVKCGPITFKQYSIPIPFLSKLKGIPVVGKLAQLTYYVFFQTCTWTAKVHYKQNFSCFEGFGSWLFGTLLCCTSVIEWDATETRTVTFHIVTTSSTVPTFPNTQTQQNVNVKPQTPAPSSARKTY